MTSWRTSREQEPRSTPN
ncbi:hypothetical protein E2C01_087706 [Portunus trituberculatus]|uniref:Uncharacterized protein n=1 Tax=Portunus trituberculatus TaxID=210409 RepID=A0A5B7JH72_PORTR|nr:hypothetical protein [Portunus trituberculatus]